jgi:hypothetical protein
MTTLLTFVLIGLALDYLRVRCERNDARRELKLWRDRDALAVPPGVAVAAWTWGPGRN